MGERLGDTEAVQETVRVGEKEGLGHATRRTRCAPESETSTTPLVPCRATKPRGEMSAALSAGPSTLATTPLPASVLTCAVARDTARTRELPASATKRVSPSAIRESRAGDVKEARAPTPSANAGAPLPARSLTWAEGRLSRRSRAPSERTSAGVGVPGGEGRRATPCRLVKAALNPAPSEKAGVDEPAIVLTSPLGVTRRTLVLSQT